MEELFSCVLVVARLFQCDHQPRQGLICFQLNRDSYGAHPQIIY